MRNVALLIMGALALAMSPAAEARQSRRLAPPPECNVIMPCDFGNQNAKPRAFISGSLQRHARGKPGRRHRHLMPVVQSALAVPSFVAPIIEPVARAAGIVPQLAVKVAEITAACGSTVISGVRHTLVAGTRTMSLHASGRAVDMRGNPACIYRVLAGWPGGYSTDYGRMRHIHISYGGREDGLRFRHGGHRKWKHRHRRR